MLLRLLSLVLLGAAFAAIAGCQEHSAPAPALEVHATRILGRVTWSGEIPPETLILSDADEAITRIRGGEPIYTERCLVSTEGGLANAFVFVKGTPDVTIPSAPDTPVILRAEKGVYTPHVVALRVGQTMQIRVSKEETHNPHPMSKLSAEFGVARLKNDPQNYIFRQQEIFRVKCDVHGWMIAHVGVFNHPWFAVTGPDGSFELTGLPPGKYKLKAWHERGGEREVDIEIGGESDDVRVDFKFDLE